MTLTTRNLIVGIFTLVGLLILALGAVLTGKKGGLFTPTYDLVAEFSTVQGLREGSPVWLQGVQVGFVKKIRFGALEEKKVLVTLTIEKEYQNLIRADSVAQTTTKGLLGDQLVEITIGSPEAPVLSGGATIPTRPASDFGSLMKGVAGAVSALGEFVTTLRDTAEKLQKGGGTLGRFLTDDRLYQELLGVVKELRRTSEELNRGKGTLGLLLHDPTLARELEALLKELRAGQGTLTQLMRDPALYQELVSTATNLRDLTARVSQGEGTLGKVVQDEELYKNLNALVLELKSLVEDMKKNPGRYFKVKVF